MRQNGLGLMICMAEKIVHGDAIFFSTSNGLPNANYSDESFEENIRDSISVIRDEIWSTFIYKPTLRMKVSTEVSV